eukprot:5255528-Prymnesium_polylepis.1
MRPSPSTAASGRGRPVDGAVGRDVRFVCNLKFTKSTPLQPQPRPGFIFGYTCASLLRQEPRDNCPPFSGTTPQ